MPYLDVSDKAKIPTTMDQCSSANKAVQLPTRFRPPVQPLRSPSTTQYESSKGNLSLTCPYTCYVQVNRSCGTLCQLNMLGPLLPVLYEVLHSKLPHHLVHAFLMNKWVKVKYKNREIFKEAVYYLRCIGLIFRPATPTYFMATVNNDTTQMNPLTSLWEKISSSVKPSYHQQLTDSSSPSGPSCSWPTPTSLGPAFHSCQQPLAWLAGVPS